MAKRVAAIHDISCIGRSSMQVIWPVLSKFGHQLCPLPTALLSAHTAIEGYTFLDLSDEMDKISGHWEELRLNFDAIYSGFLGSDEQIVKVLNFINTFSEISELDGHKRPLVLVDPVMGDEGKIYKTYTKTMCDGVRVLCKHADVITPNLTEAYILLRRPYNPDPDLAEQRELTDSLLRLGKKPKRAVVITGIHNRRQDTVGAVFAIKDKEETTYGSSFASYYDCFYPGTGDLFASILLGKLLKGDGFYESVKAAVHFISDVSDKTRNNGMPELYGLDFEEQLTLAHL